MQRGFTLIELMVVVVVLGILAAVAIPNYSAYVLRGKRTSAKTELLNAAAFLERSYTTNGCYNKTTVAVCQSQVAGNDIALPNAVAPAEGRASYSVALTAIASQQFALAAAPCTAGTCPAGSDLLVDAECGNFTLTQTGVRAITGSGTVANCWQR